jgi:putative membrane protein
VLTLDIFGFQALWSPYFFLFIMVILVAYFTVTMKYRHWFSGSERLTTKQGFWFVFSILLLYTIKGSPIDLLGHLLFYVHMIQMAVLVLIIPPLFILGIPVWVWKRMLEIIGLGSVFKFFTKPLIALILFNGLFSFYHVPMIFDRVMQNAFLHAGYSILLFFVALFMWWPLIHQQPEQERLSGIKKVGYVFANGMLLTPACALIIFSNTPLYATYSDPHLWGQMMSVCVGSAKFASLNLSGPQLFSSMSLLEDQQLGGVIMKIIQEIIYGCVLAHVFFEWYRNDQAESEKEITHLMNPTPVE